MRKKFKNGNGQARLEITRNYDLFEMNELNRPLHEDKDLLESMTQFGFMPSKAIHCASGENGKLRIIEGHHRLYYAKRLGLPVYYIVDNSVTDIYLLEKSTELWSLDDYVYSRAQAGNTDYETLVSFKEKHHLTTGVAASLLAGTATGSNYKADQLRAGEWKVGGDTLYAHRVVSIIDGMKALGIPFATHGNCVAAISRVIRVPGFEDSVFLDRLGGNPARFRKRSTINEYLDEIESAYNYASRSKRINLSFLAKEISRKRQESFGQCNLV